MSIPILWKRVAWRLGWSLLAALPLILPLPALAAIRLSQPLSASGEIDLGRIPDSRTSVFLRVRPKSWTQFISTQQPSSRILDQIAGSMDSSMASILGLCFAPAVDEFIVAKWPSQFSWDVKQPVWMMGLALGGQGSAESLANAVIASCSLSQDRIRERKLRGYPLVSLILPGRQLHLLKGERHLLISPNLFLIQGYLGSLDGPPEPPSASQPDALIGWRPGTDDLSRSGGATSGNFLKQMGIDRFEVSVQNLPVGLEIRFAARSSSPNRRKPLFRPLNPDLLDSIPADSDLVIAGGGLDLLGRGSGASPGTSKTVDRPFALGVEVTEGKGNSPQEWRVGGAVERRVAVADSPAPVSAEITERLKGLLDDLGPLGRDMRSLVVEDRILLGNAAQQSGSSAPEPQGLKDHFAEIAREAVLAGIVSPDLLVLPLYWDALLMGSNEEDQAYWMQTDWRGELAPVEFSLNQKRDGIEVRLLSASPASYVMLLADLLFFIHVDYAGEWERLFEEWARVNPTQPATRPGR